MKVVIWLLLFMAAPTVLALSVEYRPVNRYSLEKIDTLEKSAITVQVNTLFSTLKLPNANLQLYGPVMAGETLYAIALSLGVENASSDQVMMALFDNNPRAFPTKNINLLLQGMLLRVPEPYEIAKRSLLEARRLVTRHHRLWKAKTKALTGGIHDEHR